MQSVVERIKQDLERMEPESPERVAYTVETRARVVELLKAAFDKYEPRPYPGKAAMLVSSVKEKRCLAIQPFGQRTSVVLSIKSAKAIIRDCSANILRRPRAS